MLPAPKACGKGIKTGYYPDLTDPQSYCYCTGTAAPGQYTTCVATLIWNGFSGSSKFLTTNCPGGIPCGNGGLFGTNGGACEWPPTLSPTFAPTNTPTAAPTFPITTAPTMAPEVKFECVGCLSGSQSFSEIKREFVLAALITLGYDTSDIRKRRLRSLLDTVDIEVDIDLDIEVNFQENDSGTNKTCGTFEVVVSGAESKIEETDSVLKESIGNGTLKNNFESSGILDVETITPPEVTIMTLFPTPVPTPFPTPPTAPPTVSVNPTPAYVGWQCTASSMLPAPKACGKGIKTGYYPDLTDPQSFCYCTGIASPGQYTTCVANLVWNGLSGSSQFLTTNCPGGIPCGDGGLFGTTGGACDWPPNTPTTAPTIAPLTPAPVAVVTLNPYFTLSSENNVSDWFVMESKQMLSKRKKHTYDETYKKLEYLNLATRMEKGKALLSDLMLDPNSVSSISVRSLQPSQHSQARTIVAFSAPTSLDYSAGKNAMYFKNFHYFLDHAVNCTVHSTVIVTTKVVADAYQHRIAKMNNKMCRGSQFSIRILVRQDKCYDMERYVRGFQVRESKLKSSHFFVSKSFFLTIFRIAVAFFFPNNICFTVWPRFFGIQTPPNGTTSCILTVVW